MRSRSTMSSHAFDRESGKDVVSWIAMLAYGALVCLLWITTRG